MESLASLACFACAIVMYLLPAINAQWREHPQIGAIVVINLFFGWTLLGWVIALAWSCSYINPDQPKAPKHRSFRLTK